MYQKIKAQIQIFFVLSLVTTALTVLFIAIGVQPLTIAAQAPPQPPPINEETLAAFGLSPASIQSSASSFDLEIVKKTNVITADSGDPVTFTISITNHGPGSAPLTFFYDDFPPEMQGVAYSFSTLVISDGLAKPTWAFTNPIPDKGTIAITVTGILTSAPNVTVKNTAFVTAFHYISDTDSANNNSAVNIVINGYNPSNLFYLPLIFKNPQPTIILTYHENFNSGDPWEEFDISACETENRNGQYWVRHKKENRTCLPPADNDAYRTYGEFEVTAYQSEGPSKETAFGLFINGAGGDYYYFFRIWPNDSCSSGGDWQLVRRHDGDEKTILSDNCDPAIKRGGTNTLMVAHTSGHQLTVYANGTQLDAIIDNTSKHLTGKATGIYVYSEDDDLDDDDALIKFDNFKVYRYP